MQETGTKRTSVETFSIPLDMAVSGCVLDLGMLDLGCVKGRHQRRANCHEP